MVYALQKRTRNIYNPNSLKSFMVNRCEVDLGAKTSKGIPQNFIADGENDFCGVSMSKLKDLKFDEIDHWTRFGRAI